jgi:alpha-galactosidase
MAGFAIDCAGIASMEELVSGAVRLRAVAPNGGHFSIPIWQTTRVALSQELQLRPWRARAQDLAPEMLQTLLLNASPSPEATVALREAKLWFANHRMERRAPKIVFVCASGHRFTELLSHILAQPALEGSRICLYDDDATRLRASLRTAQEISRTLNLAEPITALVDLSAALTGADYVITLAAPSHGQAPRKGAEIAAKRLALSTSNYSLPDLQAIMDTQRVIPALVALVRAMETSCAKALHLNYVEPLSETTWALSRSSPIATIGLGSGVDKKAEDVAADLGVAFARMRFLAAGIHRQSFFLRLEAGGVDLYPRLAAALANGRIPPQRQAFYEGMAWLGYASAESAIPRDKSRLHWQQTSTPLGTVIDAGSSAPMPPPRAPHGATLIAAIESGTLAVIYGIVPNRGLITNLLPDCAVECACLVDRNGVQPVPVGALPPQLSAVMQPQIASQSLSVESALSGKREFLFQAVMLSPRPQPRRNRVEIGRLVDRIWPAGSRLKAGFPRPSPAADRALTPALG